MTEIQAKAKKMAGWSQFYRPLPGLNFPEGQVECFENQRPAFVGW
jgi:hypothetical protein